MRATSQARGSCESIGIGFISYSPLGRAFLTGTDKPASEHDGIDQALDASRRYLQYFFSQAQPCPVRTWAGLCAISMVRFFSRSTSPSSTSHCLRPVWDYGVDGNSRPGSWSATPSPAEGY
ncbi:hypothetical protein R3Q08_31135 [Rhodococcus erythropolis]|uniref:hypothetical protein n=1 Tax=Rhodococcus erythropolis TaxID=1833 RepID=UPI00294A3B86|nr:hypothetical protein [Rhodococcus erythropolis]MDV6212716.1 hypothetical protein [Rhodococcus erythropolis]